MHLRKSRWIILITFLLPTACSVYQSTGRKSFEGKSPETVQNRSARFQQSQEVEDSDLLTCWNQPANEPLWHVESQSALTVTQLSHNEIQVCFNESP